MSTVKITPTGKVSMAISKNLKGYLLMLITFFLNDLNKRCKQWPLAIANNDQHINRALVDEIFCKYHTQLSIINRDCKIVLTLAQAHVLWEQCQLHDQEVFINPEMGNLLMELHKKLI